MLATSVESFKYIFHPDSLLSFGSFDHHNSSKNPKKISTRAKTQRNIIWWKLQRSTRMGKKSLTRKPKNYNFSNNFLSVAAVWMYERLLNTEYFRFPALPRTSRSRLEIILKLLRKFIRMEYSLFTIPQHASDSTATMMSVSMENICICLASQKSSPGRAYKNLWQQQNVKHLGKVLRCTRE